MSRLIDEIGLFASGVGSGTSGDIKCEWCGTNYGGREGKGGNGIGETLSFADFGKFQVVECCFDAVERTVLGHIDDIIAWYRRLLVMQRERLTRREGALAALDESKP